MLPIQVQVHFHRLRWAPARRAATAVAVLIATAGCGSSANAPAAALTPVYSESTGKLEQLVSDADHDGKADVRMFMDGTRLTHAEIDRNGDGTPDRWEYYEMAAPATRREFYVAGIIDHVEEDSDGDGRPDKWEEYRDGALARLDLDLRGKGWADRRLVYAPDGSLDHAETDADGDGHFEVERKPAVPSRVGRSGGG
jgi:hypothetical protein